ncbi:hypothetical protein [Paenibacillus sp. FSL L8-0709]|uniref:hypothetical protein n=1 Tax=Paenibacillus sp. FSL L8-0709 TaxID=2975312 RepID=UPI0030FA3AFD
MKAIRNILGFALILIILSGLGYIGWFVSKEQNITWSSLLGSQSVANPHNQHTSAEATTTQTADVNPVDNLQAKVTSSYKSIQQVAELMSSSSVNPSLIGRYQRGLYSLSEGVYLMNQLDQNLGEMARLTDATDPTYQVYANRHNVMVQTQSVLNNVSQKLSDAKEMFLSNVMTNTAEASIEAGDVQQINKAIYQMAQTVMELQGMNEWLDNQIQLTMGQAEQAQLAVDALAAENASNIQTSGFSIGNVQLPTLVTMLTILFAVLMLVGIIGATRNLVSKQPKIENEQMV